MAVCKKLLNFAAILHVLKVLININLKFMKKKFINGLLMAALFVGFTSSVISCKDYDDEKLVELQGVLADTEADLRQALETQKAGIAD